MNAVAKREAVAKPPTLSSDPWRWLHAEGWYAGLLYRLTRQDIQDGDTTVAIRMARIRALVRDNHLADKPVVPSRSETHRQFFRRLYGELLDSSQETLF